MQTSKATTVGQALDALPVGRSHYLVVALTCSVCFSAAFAGQIGPYVFPGLADEFQLSNDVLGVHAAASSIGSLIGTATGVLVDRIGRKPAMVFGFATACLCNFIAAAIPATFTILLVLRTIESGCGLLAFSSAMVWLQEHLPTTGRGTFYALAILGYPIGKETMIGVASILPVAQWRLLLLISGALSGAIAHRASGTLR